MKTFNVDVETELASEFNYRSEAQKTNANRLNAERILVLDRSFFNVSDLPKYIKSAVADEGYLIKKIGVTTYKNTVFALYRRSPWPWWLALSGMWQTRRSR